jgi:hypothetical protein
MIAAIDLSHGCKVEDATFWSTVAAADYCRRDMRGPILSDDAALLDLERTLDDLVAATRRRAGAVPGSRQQREASVEIRRAVERLRTWDRPRMRAGREIRDRAAIPRLITG